MNPVIREALDEFDRRLNHPEGELRHLVLVVPAGTDLDRDDWASLERIARMGRSLNIHTCIFIEEGWIKLHPAAEVTRKVMDATNTMGRNPR